MLKRYLLNTTFVSSTFKAGFEEGVEYLLGCLIVDKSARKDDDIRIIMLSSQLGNILVPYQASTYALVFIKCYGHSFTATTDRNSRVHLTTLYGFSQWVSIIRIVAT